MRSPRPALALTFLAALACPWAGAARAESNTTAFTFEAMDARAFGMGGTLVALPHDDTGMRWNPAQLVFSVRPSATAAYSIPVVDLGASHGAATASLPFGEVLPDAAPELPVHRSAVGVLLMNTGLDLSEGARWSENQIGIGYARALESYATFGIALRLLSNSTDVAEGQASGYGIDLGSVILLSPHVELGAAIRNAIGRVKWTQTQVSESPATTMAVGVGIVEGSAKGEAGFEVSGAQGPRVSAGAEWGLLGGSLLLRGGARAYLGLEPRGLLTAGLGLRTGSLHVDAGFQMDQADGLGSTQAFSLGYQF